MSPTQRTSAKVALLLGLVLASSTAHALEEHFATLSASVEVAPVFSLTLSNPHLAFHQVSPGKTEVLGEENFFNEVRCRSNSGRAWHLKAELVSLKHVERNAALPPAQLKLRVVQASGEAQAMLGRADFQSFSDQSLLLYSSQGNDNRGQEVVLRFQYSLSCPFDAPAGNYVGQVVFTMAEGL